MLLFMVLCKMRQNKIKVSLIYSFFYKTHFHMRELRLIFHLNKQWPMSALGMKFEDLNSLSANRKNVMWHFYWLQCFVPIILCTNAMYVCFLYRPELFARRAFISICSAILVSHWPLHKPICSRCSGFYLKIRWCRK